MSGEHADWPQDRERERSASPRRNGGGDRGGGRSRSRSPVRDRMDTDERRDGGDRGRTTTAGGNSQNPGNNLHVSGLSTRVEDRDLEEIFGKFGRIEKVSVMRDPHSRESRGFAFVTMEQVEDAEAAITGLAATELFGKTIGVEKARRARARTPTPGQYQGPPKRDDGYRPYEPSRYGGGGYSDRHRDDRYREDRYREDRYRDDRRFDSRRDTGYAVPMRGGDDRRYEERRDYDRYQSSSRYDDRRERDRYDDRRRY